MMTSKERWLAALKMEPVDRLPFWPKLDYAYPRAQREPFSSMTIAEIHDWIGSDKFYGIPNLLPSFIKEERRHTSIDNQQKGKKRKTIYKTKYGNTELIERFDVDSQSWHPVKFPIENKKDIELMIEWYSDCQVELKKRILKKAKNIYDEIGEEVLLSYEIGQSPLMHFVEWLAGIENAHYLLMDYTEEVEELFEVIHKLLKRKTEIMSENNPSDLLFFIENTSTTMISPQQYIKYCVKHIQDYGEIITNDDELLVLHMCGHLKKLLPEMKKLNVTGFEAFTSSPVGNTSLLEGREKCPDKCFIGGTNAELWTKESEDIIKQIKKDLDELPHHRGIALTSAGVMPPLCKPEDIKKVFEWVKTYNVKV